MTVTSMPAQVTYHCVACAATSEADLLSLDTRAEVNDALVRVFTASYLQYAVCPRCGAHNPEGLAEERREQRNIKLFTVAVTAVLAIGAYFTRWIAVALIALFVALIVWGLVQAKAARAARTRRERVRFAFYRLLDLAIVAAAIAIVVRWPRLAPLVPLLIGVTALREKSTQGDSALWARSAEHLRFRGSAFRD